jgi:aromatic ring-opening dioxygenase catalytic subunit (LigB family)
LVSGMLEIRRRLHALRPDVLVLASSDHLNNFNLAVQVTLAVGIADEYVSWGDAGLPQVRFAGHRALGEDFAQHARRRDFDLVQVEEVRPDHGMMTPKIVMDPENRIPTVPVYINAAMPVPPSPAQCYRLGRVLKETVETLRPERERVVVIGAGGMSHWLCLPQEGEVAAEFDQNFLARMVDGRSEELARITTQEMVEASGNGGLELTAWLFMAGALHGARGEKIYYEAIPKWISGMGGLSLTP